MAEHDDDLGPSTPAPDPSPGGDLGDLNFAATGPANEPGAPASFAQVAPHEAAFKHAHAAPETPDEVPRRPVFPLLLGAAMVLTFLVALYLNRQPLEPSGMVAAPAPGTETASAPAPDAPSTPAPTSTPTPGPEVGEIAKSLGAEIEEIKDEMKVLEDRVEAMPKPDLAPLNSKINRLAEDSQAVSSLPTTVGELDRRVASLDASIAALKGEVEALRAESKKPVESPAPAAATATAARSEEAGGDDAAFNRGADLFQEGKFKEASDSFLKLTETKPDDARAWYYAAISRGSATNQWQGETTRLVTKGVEREKAGTPESARIDAAFADLKPSVKSWLDAYRKRSRPR